MGQGSATGASEAPRGRFSGCKVCRCSSRRRRQQPKEGPLASTIEIAPRTDADLPLLFGLAKAAFVDLPGWSDERVLAVLRRDVTFVAREQGQPAGYVALHPKE